ncbi:M4 family metallopeptidase [Streptomyces sp. NPDC007901]|uniref:M4 family metallopeptidase n=1 Tax=Streptomyces sp. NPDC007901 TaxID=3364785 RepID=UPI0036E263A9
MAAHRIFCTLIPPHILMPLATQADPALAYAARRTLERDAYERTHRDLTSLLGVPRVVRPAEAEADRPYRTVYDGQHGIGLPGAKMVSENSEDASGDAAVNRAYTGLGAAFDLFFDAYGRRSLDSDGLPLTATVHYDEGYCNAFWNGEQMVFGDGDGEFFLDLTKSIDAIGHELTHGVTQYTANLGYHGQAGALNESMSDVFGSLVKQYAFGQMATEADWLIGAGILSPRVNGVALRSLKAPGTAYDDEVLGKDPQPATMDGYVRTAYDNGGVHINSGIPNHAFYLFAAALGGHAWERAGQIWYDVLTGGELPEMADFGGFARLTAQAAIERYGHGEEIQALMKAWHDVGVSTEGGGGGGNSERRRGGFAGATPPPPPPQLHTSPGPDIGGDDDEW